MGCVGHRMRAAQPVQQAVQEKQARVSPCKQPIGLSPGSAMRCQCSPFIEPLQIDLCARHERWFCKGHLQLPQLLLCTLPPRLTSPSSVSTPPAQAPRLDNEQDDPSANTQTPGQSACPQSRRARSGALAWRPAVQDRSNQHVAADSAPCAADRHTLPAAPGLPSCQSLQARPSLPLPPPLLTTTSPHGWAGGGRTARCWHRGPAHARQHAPGPCLRPPPLRKGPPGTPP